MSLTAILVVLLAIAATAAGFAMVFRPQWLLALIGREGAPRRDDPAIYVLRIFGMMLSAFGLTIAGFTLTRFVLA